MTRPSDVRHSMATAARSAVALTLKTACAPRRAVTIEENAE
ncbi:hypothetical protein C8K30_10126 [Promicromonospora sp. AC04]|nr:hypothetical protein C8K30_10126 [Promicromonospora sp. AC04]